LFFPLAKLDYPDTKLKQDCYIVRDANNPLAGEYRQAARAAD
jgi:hypothetical protein